ncbi:MAG: hypothetical protein GY701_01230, partial [Sulfitobacter sp.]|nr:hypothetical protein [Sulfitobacter sp.]
MTNVGNGPTGQGGLRVGLDSKDSPLRVHIVPHSHCDSGWLKTYTEYYWG